MPSGEYPIGFPPAPQTTVYATPPAVYTITVKPKDGGEVTVSAPNLEDAERLLVTAMQAAGLSPTGHPVYR